MRLDTLPAWQPSLLDGHEGADRPITRVHLDHASWVDHSPAWWPDAGALFERLVTGLEWRADERRMYERVVAVPRLTAAVPGDSPLRRDLHPAVEALSDRYGVLLDRIWCNLYRDGADSVAWHGDRVRHTCRDPLVAIVSLGERRRFLLKPRAGGTSRRWDLGQGDLLVMGGSCQHDHLHCVPKVARAGPRLSVTFRHTDA